MEALIRAARLAPLRVRLSRQYPQSASVPTYEEPAAAAAKVREEIEKQVRAEQSAEMRRLYQAERERAHADGYQEGLDEGRRAADEELAKLRAQLKTKLQDALALMQRTHAAALSKLEASVGEVAFAAVCRLVSSRAASDTFVLGLVEHACAQLRTDTVATARLHPRDIETLNGLLAGDPLRIQALGVKLVPDESLQLGGCIIEAESGQYDGGLENQLRRLHAVLTGASPAPGTDGEADPSGVAGSKE